VCFGDPEKMSSDPLGANRPVERQDFVEQSDRQTVGHHRGEFGFQKQHLWADALAQQLCQRAHRDRWALGAWTNPDPFAVEPQLAEWCPEHDRMVALQRTPIATVGAGALISLPFCHLNAGESLLNAARR
jgi:hypothetical protein